MRNQELSCSTSALWQELALGNPGPGPPSTTLWIIYLVKPAETTHSVTCCPSSETTIRGRGCTNTISPPQVNKISSMEGEAYLIVGLKMELVEVRI